MATIESLRGKRGIHEDAEPHPRPEIPRGAKEKLEARMHRGVSYSETADQAALTAQFDLSAAYARCRSFRRMVTGFGRLVKRSGLDLTDWPPRTWRSPA